MSRIWQSPTVAQRYLDHVQGAIPLATEQLDVTSRLLAAQPQPVRRFLDLGCGAGFLAAAILDQFPDAVGVLLDFSGTMLDAARAKRPGCTFLQVDYGEPSWTDSVAPWAPFDAIVSRLSIHHQPDDRKRELYHELAALLAPDGLLLNIDHVSSPTPWIERIWDDLVIDCQTAFSGRPRAEVANEHWNRPDKAANILAPVELQCEWLREAGLADVDCFFKVFELAVFGGRRKRADA